MTRRLLIFLLTVATSVSAGCSETPTEQGVRGESPSAGPESSPTALALPRDDDGFLALVPEADAVVVANLASQRSYWNADNTLILTDWELAVTEQLHGERTPRLVLTQGGGVVGDVSLDVSSSTTFEPRETYALLLQNTPMGLGIVRGPQGVRRLDSASHVRANFLTQLAAAVAAAHRKESE
jgi:hypothetical protein